MNTRQSLWDTEQEFLQKQKELHPELFVPPKKHGKELLEYLSAYIPPAFDAVAGRACIKLYPQDFIVEELHQDGSVVSIFPQHDSHADATGTTVYAVLTKVGISTLEAVDRLASALSIPTESISYRGIKDAIALTAQDIAFRGVTVAQVTALSFSEMILTDIHLGKGVLQPGTLSGNRFTIVIRPEQKITQAVLAQGLATIEKEGVLNLYGTQRFGSPRFVSHILGRYVCTGDVQGLLRAFLTQTSAFEYPFITQLRTSADAVFGTWDAMCAIYSVLPYTFRYELATLEQLVLGKKIEEALYEAKDQIDFWAKSYASFLLNELLLSAKQYDLPIPPQIPLLLAHDPRPVSLYRPFLERDGALDYQKKIRTFPYVTVGRYSELPTRILPKNTSYVVTDTTTVLRFELPKGAYATTVLQSLFTLEATEESGISTELVDSFALLGDRSLVELGDRLPIGKKI